MPQTPSKKIQALRRSRRQQNGLHDCHILYRKREVMLTLMRKKRQMKGAPLMLCVRRESVDFEDHSKLRLEVKQLLTRQEYGEWERLSLPPEATANSPSSIGELPMDHWTREVTCPKEKAVIASTAKALGDVVAHGLLGLGVRVTEANNQLI
jgi:hypothetical protein